MNSKLKNALKKVPFLLDLARIGVLAKYEITDVYASYLSNSLKVKNTPYGFKFRGSKSTHHLAMQRGEFEPEETALFLKEFERAEVFVDIGANVGYFTCLARTKGMHVVAVEPLQKNVEYLIENMIANQWSGSNVEIFPMGLSDQPGIATLYGASSTGALSLVSGRVHLGNLNAPSLFRLWIYY